LPLCHIIETNHQDEDTTLINPERAFNEIFNDKNVLEKLAITSLIFLLSLFSSVFLIGLVGWAALVGYQMEITRNVRDGMPFPLPRWTNFGQKINLGTGLLIAGAIYNVPNMLLFCFMTTIFNANSGLFAVGSVCCCLLPVMIGINLVLVPLQAVGTVRFAETGRVESFLKFTELFDIIRANTVVLFQWWLWATLANVVIGVVGGLIPCLGWLATSALLIPVQGHLMGQLASALAESKRKNQSL
jgi:hypothetical protein